MRAVFSALLLLVVLAAVGFSAMNQLKASRISAAEPPGRAASASSAMSPNAPAAVQARQIQDQVREDLNKALEQAASRNQEPAP